LFAYRIHMIQSSEPSFKRFYLFLSTTYASPHAR
jgi:hypothetical protein